jgi:hypothetical protein
MSLHSAIFERYGQRTADAVDRFFDDMQLPRPEDGEFSETDDKGYLVFLNDTGTVIRLTKKRDGLWSFSPRVLHPLGTRIAGRLRADINPGITCPITDEQREELRDGLHVHKLDFVDHKLYNGGTLPAVANLIKEGYAVAIDPIAVRDLSSSVGLVKRWLKRAFTPGHAASAEAPDDPQAIIYRPLKDIFKAAWPSGSNQPDAGLIRKFWDKAREMKTSGLLKASWLTQEMASRNYNNIYEGSRAYEGHMHTNRIFASLSRQ